MLHESGAVRTLAQITICSSFERSTHYVELLAPRMT
jgi:hypothetical protein